MIKSIVTILITSLFAFTGTSFAIQVPGPLVETDWIIKNQDNKNLVVLDVRNKPNLEKYGYIPDSRLWAFENVRVNRTINGIELEGMVPTQEQFKTTMQQLGITNDTAVVIAPLVESTSTLTMGTRAYWTFKYYGHSNVSILNGGVTKWISDGNKTVKHPAEVKEQSTYIVKSVNDGISATTEEVAKSSQGNGVQLIDGRTPDFYVGEKKKDYVFAPGHIPTAKDFPHTLILDEKTKTFQPASTIKQLFADKGIDIAKPSIVYCDSGHLSTGLWFVLHELLGNQGVKQYDGSMHEWTKDSQRPVVKDGK